MQTLTHAEVEQSFLLRGNYLYSGFYLNELLQRLLPENFAAPALFHDYLTTLQLLSEQVLLEPVLRRFEWQLLKGLELDFSFTHDAISQAELQPNDYYRFIPEQGFVAVHDRVLETDFMGHEIAKLARFEFADERALRRYKQLMRMALQPYLGNKPLQSRNLFKVTNSR